MGWNGKGGSGKHTEMAQEGASLPSQVHQLTPHLLTHTWCHSTSGGRNAFPRHTFTPSLKVTGQSSIPGNCTAYMSTNNGCISGRLSRGPQQSSGSSNGRGGYGAPQKTERVRHRTCAATRGMLTSQTQGAIASMWSSDWSPHSHSLSGRPLTVCKNVYTQ